MAQRKIIRDGWYSCPVCNNLYEIKNADPEKDGYCQDCQNKDEASIALRYEGPLNKDKTEWRVGGGS